MSIGSLVLVGLCAAGAAAVATARTDNFTDGAAVSPETLTSSELEALESLFAADSNSTDELAKFIYAKHPHSTLSVEEIIRLHDYNVEVHEVETYDGYILRMFRITGRSGEANPSGKPAVLIQHGLLCSSMDWVLAGPKRGLAFLLSDAGYDVWLGNARGSRYSRGHRRYNVRDKRYWSFDWHEIGTRDLPRMIDRVLDATGRKRIHYIGHSQGSTAFFVMASELPEYNDRINAMFSLAPIVYCSNMFSPIFQALSRLTEPLSLLTSLIGLHEFKPTNSFVQKYSSIICKGNSALHPLCSNILFIVAGFNKDQLDLDLLPAILANVPAGAGVNQFVHYAQIIKSGHFRQLDYGFLGNLQRYRSVSPPAYNLKNVRAPVSLHYSVNDWLSNPVDVQKLYSKLPNPIGKFRVPHDKFNHLDYLWAKDVKPLLYDKILSLMERYQD